jgi:hypothetical protein
MAEGDWTMCHGCGGRAEGKHDICPTCGSNHVRISNIAWLQDKEPKGSDFYPRGEYEI